jgi:hypothetical protein
MARRNTRKSAPNPVMAYIARISGRFVSVPPNTPCASIRENAGTASRWILRQRTGRRLRRIQELTTTSTVAYIAVIPRDVATGR